MPTKKTPAKTSAKTRSRPAATKQDAVALLTADHQAIAALFAQFQQARANVDDEACAALVQQICDELTVHTTVEQEIFYPAVQAAIDDDELMDEAEVEHAGAMDLVVQLEGMEPGDPLYAAKVTVLSEYVKHHVGEEEREMFPKARQAGRDGSLDLGALAGALEARKRELEAQTQMDEDAASP